jgi:hypothetical protein
MIIFLLIIGIGNIFLSGAWAGTIFVDRTDGLEIEGRQYFWSIGCFLFGLYAIIACIGHVSSVK